MISLCAHARVRTCAHIKISEIATRHMSSVQYLQGLTRTHLRAIARKYDVRGNSNADLITRILDTVPESTSFEAILNECMTDGGEVIVPRRPKPPASSNTSVARTPQTSGPVVIPTDAALDLMRRDELREMTNRANITSGKTAEETRARLKSLRDKGFVPCAVCGIRPRLRSKGACSGCHNAKLKESKHRAGGNCTTCIRHHPVFDIDHAQTRCDECIKKSRRDDDRRSGTRTSDNAHSQRHRESRRANNATEYLQQNALSARVYRFVHHKEIAAWKRGNARCVLNVLKGGARDRQIEWNLTDEDALLLINGDCAYCGIATTPKVANGIDRVANEQSYDNPNCVTCCSTCNCMKGTLDPVTFVQRCIHISGEGDHSDAWRDPLVKRARDYETYVRGADARGIPFKLTREMFAFFTSKPCAYCNRPPESGIDCDDNDHDIGYVAGNCVPCCSECNYMKSVSMGTEFRAKCLRVPRHTDAGSWERYGVPRWYRTCRRMAQGPRTDAEPSEVDDMDCIDKVRDEDGVTFRFAVREPPLWTTLPLRPSTPQHGQRLRARHRARPSTGACSAAIAPPSYAATRTPTDRRGRHTNGASK
jgi:hypothetical protein